MITDKQIQKHIEENCRYKDGQPLMDEQAFYEGAKWMREKVSRVEPEVRVKIAELAKELAEEVISKYQLIAEDPKSITENEYLEYEIKNDWIDYFTEKLSNLSA